MENKPKLGDFRIWQRSDKEFVVQQFLDDISYIGLWNKKRITQKWTSVSERGVKIVWVNLESFHTHKSLKDAKKNIKDIKKYPVYHY